MDYLIAKGKVVLNNEFVSHLEKWRLICYPGKPLKSEVYFWQKNFFKLKNPENVYENSFYDTLRKKLYDFTKVNLNKI